MVVVDVDVVVVDVDVVVVVVVVVVDVVVGGSTTSPGQPIHLTWSPVDVAKYFSDDFSERDKASAASPAKAKGFDPCWPSTTAYVVTTILWNTTLIAMTSQPPAGLV